HRSQLPLAVEVAVFLGPFIEDVGIVVDVIDIVEEIQHQAEVGYGDDARRLRSRTIEVLMEGVEWNAEGRARLPLKGVLGLARHLDSRRSAAGDNIDRLLVQMALLIELA